MRPHLPCLSRLTGAVPSRPSLDMIAERLHLTAATILESVDRELEGVTGDGADDRTAFPRSG